MSATSILKQFLYQTQLQSARLQTHLKLRPFLLTIVGLPLLLLSTLAFTGQKTFVYPAKILSVNTPPAGMSYEAVERPAEQLNHYRSENINFSFPLSWNLDTTEVSKTRQIYTLRADASRPFITISVLPSFDRHKYASLSDYLVETFESDNNIERYFLRESPTVNVEGVAVNAIQYATVLDDKLSRDGLKSARGIKSAFATPAQGLVVIDLSASYSHSYGNYLEVEAMRGLYDGIIASMIN